jgi:ribosomal protein S27E
LHDAVEMEREAREMKSRATVVTCSVCGATNIVEPNGVPKIQCSGCARILVVRRPAQPRLETR